MSRSYKKHGVTKGPGLKRREYSGIIRKRNKQRVYMGLEPLDPRQIINSWSICDYSFRWYGDHAERIEYEQHCNSKYGASWKRKFPTFKDYKRCYFKK